ncbi:hypothetical protein [Kingella potus]|uniref:hypothetical protein n=1 Tax=Kingella potus TaxID=265175 RepID=UPI001FD56654|nr:hypothetical protein [Kingella potus]UOP00213.1 hypothetical protein LVJ84_09785 [Kingella potus]
MRGLRHTPYPNRRGRLKKHVGCVAQRRRTRPPNPATDTPRRKNKNRVRGLRHTPYTNRRGRLKKHVGCVAQRRRTRSQKASKNPYRLARSVYRPSDARVSQYHNRHTRRKHKKRVRGCATHPTQTTKAV